MTRPAKDDLAMMLEEAARGGDDRASLELVSVAAQRAAERGAGPSELAEALLAADLARFVPTAAECHHHATVCAIEERTSRELAEAAPIVQPEPGVLLAVPVGPLGPDGFSRFCDRLLAEVLATGARRVRLVARGLFPFADLDEAVAALEADLGAQRVRLDRL